MTTEQLLYGGISGLVSALIFVFRSKLKQDKKIIELVEKFGGHNETMVQKYICNDCPLFKKRWKEYRIFRIKYKWAKYIMTHMLG